MCTIERASEPLYRSFAAVSLADLDARADMRTRFESKYIIATDAVGDLLRDASCACDVLEIGGRRDFGYETRYFDDERYSSYHAHRQGRRRRFKVRVRRYIETGACVAEIKLRWLRGLTIKRRSPCRGELHGGLSADALDTIRSAHRELYGAELDAPLLPAIDVRYRRITLAARGEPLRITIDSDLTFAAGGRTWRCARNAVIVEVKATTRSRYARTLFGQFGQRPVERLSKYCLGMAVSGTVQETNRFHRVLRRLGLEPGLSGAETGRRADRPGE